MKNDHDRVAVYAERFFQRHNRERFPTVRRVAKSLKLRHCDVILACSGDPQERLILTGYNFCDEGDCGFPGDLYVEVI